AVRRFSTVAAMLFCASGTTKSCSRPTAFIRSSPRSWAVSGQSPHPAGAMRQPPSPQRGEGRRLWIARNDKMPAPGENLRINADRLWESIHAMAEIGPGVAGGNNRQTLTDDDAKGRALFRRWCEDAGMSVGVDQMGTMFARREGEEPGL